ncbi:RimJ/RimL family protein N-acetyltransferase [Elusimicrobium posterum]|uniref:GNAT family N-acetyltransferase n=1 Tax=Elusimicrobium posterum TaxID=3116653 RepID=UPI003C725123
MPEISFKNILDTPNDFQLKLLEYRNNPEIYRYFLTHEVTLEDHKKWLQSLKESKSKAVYIFFYDGRPAGQVSITGYDKENKTLETGNYLFSLTEFAGKGLAFAAMVYFIDFIFSKLEAEHINIEVFEKNTKALKYNERLGYKVYGSRMFGEEKLLLLSLTKDAWLSTRPALEENLKRGNYSLKGEIENGF